LKANGGEKRNGENLVIENSISSDIWRQVALSGDNLKSKKWRSSKATAKKENWRREISALSMAGVTGGIGEKLSAKSAENRRRGMARRCSGGEGGRRSEKAGDNEMAACGNGE